MSPQVQVGPELLLGATMLCAGVLGGTLSHLLGATSSPDGDAPAESSEAVQRRGRRPITSILEGVVAAGVVPLFLALTGSNLVEDLLAESAWKSGHFHFLGLCLIAALGAPAFLYKVGTTAFGGLEIALRESESARRAAEQAASQANNVSNALIASSDITTSADDAPAAHHELALSPDEARVMEELKKSTGRRFFTESALRERTDLSRNALKEALANLEEAGAVARIDTQGVAAWFLTLEGRLRASLESGGSQPERRIEEAEGA